MSFTAEAKGTWDLEPFTAPLPCLLKSCFGKTPSAANPNSRMSPFEGNLFGRMGDRRIQC